MASWHQRARPMFLLVTLLIVVGCKPNAQNSPLNSPLQPFSTPMPMPVQLPRPAPGTGVIGGVLKIEHTDQPMVGVDLYLARNIGVTKDTPIYNLEPDSAPHAITGDDGRFVFKDVPPGRYAIVIWNPFNSFLARDPATGLEMVIDVEPDQVYDIGTLFEPHP
jgi:hypothetical protein